MCCPSGGVPIGLSSPTLYHLYPHITRGGFSITSNIFIIVGSAIPDVGSAMEMVNDDSCGGTALFVGTVRSPDDGRDVEFLDYEVWPERVESDLRDIASAALDTCGASKAFVAHRTGRVPVGEASVVVAVSAPHRAEAFDACRKIIDDLKAGAPIWKSEVAEGGQRWVANS